MRQIQWKWLMLAYFLAASPDPRTLQGAQKHEFEIVLVLARGETKQTASAQEVSRHLQQFNSRAVDNPVDARTKSARILLDNLSADEVPLETCFQLATLRDEDSELKRLAIFLLAKGTLSIKLRAAAEEKLFMLERREDTEDDVRYHALKMLLFLSRSPNTALRDSTRFLKSAESTAELLEALSLDLFTASVELSQFSTDSAANCILAALAEDLSAERRAALLNALHPLKTHDKSFDSLCPQTRADIQEVAESYFSDDRNSAPLRLNAASLMYVDLGVSDSATLAAQRIVADDKSNPRLVSFAKRLLERVKRQKMATDPK